MICSCCGNEIEVSREAAGVEEYACECGALISVAGDREWICLPSRLTAKELEAHKAEIRRIASATLPHRRPGCDSAARNHPHDSSQREDIERRPHHIPNRSRSIPL